MKYEVIADGLRSATAKAAAALCVEVLGSLDEKEYFWKLANRRDVCLILCSEGDELIGFKLGYGRNRLKFYSWLGGVSQGRRRQGIARELMRRQHAWCRTRGFKVIETQALNACKEMLILNLQEGFEITGVRASKSLGFKIILEKTLG